MLSLIPAVRRGVARYATPPGLSRDARSTPLLGARALPSSYPATAWLVQQHHTRPARKIQRCSRDQLDQHRFGAWCCTGHAWMGGLLPRTGYVPAHSLVVDDLARLCRLGRALDQTLLQEPERPVRRSPDASEGEAGRAGLNHGRID